MQAQPGPGGPADGRRALPVQPAARRHHDHSVGVGDRPQPSGAVEHVAAGWGQVAGRIVGVVEDQQPRPSAVRQQPPDQVGQAARAQLVAGRAELHGQRGHAGAHRAGPRGADPPGPHPSFERGAGEREGDRALAHAAEPVQHVDPCPVGVGPNALWSRGIRARGIRARDVRARDVRFGDVRSRDVRPGEDRPVTGVGSGDRVPASGGELPGQQVEQAVSTADRGQVGEPLDRRPDRDRRRRVLSGADPVPGADPVAARVRATVSSAPDPTPRLDPVADLVGVVHPAGPQHVLDEVRRPEAGEMGATEVTADRAGRHVDGARHLPHAQPRALAHDGQCTAEIRVGGDGVQVDLVVHVRPLSGGERQR